MTQGQPPAVADLLLPGTPEQVASAYLSLAARADAHSFGPLEEDVVVLDTETTGLSFKDCSLIEISAARLSGREVVSRFETFVRPTEPIPPEIQRLTGISELDVADAPEATEEPVATDAPEATDAPAATEAPEASEEPAA